MSKVLKGIGKVFKKVVNVIKKVAPIALAAGAILFTAGGALGVGAAAGGWGAAASSLTSSLGLSGTLGSIVTGAITQAGYGAAIGGLTSAVTGGSIGKGIKAGALTGAVTGGVMGGLGMGTDPLGKTFNQTSDSGLTGGISAQGAGDLSLSAADPAVQAANTATTSVQPGLMPTATNAVTPAMGVAPEVAAAQTAGKYMLAGNVIQGLGAGLSASGQAKEDRRAREDRTANYETGTAGLLDQVNASQSFQGQPTRERGRFVRDPETGRLVYIPAGG